MTKDGQTTSLEQSLLQANKQRYDEAENPLKSHGPDHHWRVYQYALTLVEKLGVTYDADILAGASTGGQPMAASFIPETSILLP